MVGSPGQVCATERPARTMLHRMNPIGNTICPYCGHAATQTAECERCRGLFEPLSRQASQNAMGPWYLRDESNPFRPGCSYGTLKMLAGRGRVGPETILRGPSTRQFWMPAKNVPGIAHLLGACHACKGVVASDEPRCPSCGVSFEVEEDRQYLGLAEVRPLPGQAGTQEIARAAGGLHANAGIGERSLSGDAPNAFVNERASEQTINVEYERGMGSSIDARRDEGDEVYSNRSATPRKRRGASGVVIGLIIASALGMLVVFAVAVTIAVKSAQAAKQQGGATTGP